jgi:rsbT co-antagonist protein RsbR
VLFDLTGVPVLDAQAAQSLQLAVDASSLLGARMMLVGIAPEVAQTMVALGLDMRAIETAADLQSAIRQVLSRSGIRPA